MLDLVRALGTNRLFSRDVSVDFSAHENFGCFFFFLINKIPQFTFSKFNDLPLHQSSTQLIIRITGVIQYLHTNIIKIVW